MHVTNNLSTQQLLNNNTRVTINLPSTVVGMVGVIILIRVKGVGLSQQIVIVLEIVHNTHYGTVFVVRG